MKLSKLKRGLDGGKDKKGKKEGQKKKFRRPKEEREIGYFYNL